MWHIVPIFALRIPPHSTITLRRYKKHTGTLNLVPVFRQSRHTVPFISPNESIFLTLKVRQAIEKNESVKQSQLFNMYIPVPGYNCALPNLFLGLDNIICELLFFLLWKDDYKSSSSPCLLMRTRRIIITVFFFSLLYLFQSYKNIYFGPGTSITESADILVLAWLCWPER